MKAFFICLVLAMALNMTLALTAKAEDVQRGDLKAAVSASQSEKEQALIQIKQQLTAVETDGQE